MKKIILNISFFLLLGFLQCFGQTTELNSLKISLTNAKQDSSKCNILTALIEAEEDDTVWMKYNHQLKLIAERNLNSSSLTANQKKIYLQHLANAFNNAGFFYNNKGQMNEALDNCNRSLKIQKEIDDKEGIAESLNTLATIYEKQGQVKKALDHFMSSLKISEEIGDKEGAAATLMNLGLITQNLGQAKEALGYFNHGLKIQEEIGDKEGIATSLNNIGGVYHKAGEEKEALEYYTRSMKINEGIGNKEGIANSLNNIGTLYVRTGKLNEALSSLQSSLKIYEEEDKKTGVVTTVRNIGAIYLKQGKLNEAFTYAGKGLELARELGYPGNIESNAQLMSLIYEKQNKGLLSLEMYKLYIQMRDSVKNKENQRAAFRKEAQYKYEKQRAEDSVITANDIQVKNLEIENQRSELGAKKTQQYYLFGGLVLLMIFAGFMFNRFKVAQKQKRIIEEQKLVVEEQKNLVEEKQKEILDSIRYAKRIQTALLPSEKYIQRKMKEVSGS